MRRDGDWEAWLAFFLDGVEQTADGAVAAAQQLVSLFRQDRSRVQEEGRSAGSALRVHETLQERPITSLRQAVRRTGLSYPAVSAGMQVLEQVGIARELTGKQRNRLYGYDAFLAILREGTEPS